MVTTEGVAGIPVPPFSIEEEKGTGLPAAEDLS